MAKSCLTNLTAFYNTITGLLDEGRTVDPDCTFIKASSAVFHKILIDKLMKHGLYKWRVKWTENWLNCWTQKFLISGTKSLLMFPRRRYWNLYCLTSSLMTWQRNRL